MFKWTKIPKKKSFIKNEFNMPKGHFATHLLLPNAALYTSAKNL